jgi:hypothetical protein
VDSTVSVIGLECHRQAALLQSGFRRAIFLCPPLAGVFFCAQSAQLRSRIRSFFYKKYQLSY